MENFQKPKMYAPFLLAQISSRKIDPTRLTHHQMRVCIRYLLQDGKHTQTEIAMILKTSNATVTRTKDLIRRQNMWMLDDMDERRVALDLIQTAENAVARLSRQQKHRDAWCVLKECVETLQKLGFLKQAPIQVDFNATLQEILRHASDSKDETFLGKTGQGASKNSQNRLDQLL